MSRVEEIIRLESEIETSREASQWDVARLIWEELETGKTQRVLAEEIGKTQQHVSYMAKAHKISLDNPGCMERPFSSTYNEAKRPTPKTDPEEKAAEPKAVPVEDSWDTDTHRDTPRRTYLATHMLIGSKIQELRDAGKALADTPDELDYVRRSLDTLQEVLTEVRGYFDGAVAREIADAGKGIVRVYDSGTPPRERKIPRPKSSTASAQYHAGNALMRQLDAFLSLSRDVADDDDYRVSDDPHTLTGTLTDFVIGDLEEVRDRVVSALNWVTVEGPATLVEDAEAEAAEEAERAAA